MVLLSPPVSLDKRSFAPHCPFASRCINKYQQHTAGGNPTLDSHPIHFFIGRVGGGDGVGKAEILVSAPCSATESGL